MVIGEYGYVVCLNNKHQGQVGYYDNDEGARCVVYFGSLDGRYSMISPKYLRKATEIEAKQHEARHPILPKEAT